MAETTDNHDQHTFPSKRKSDHETQDLPNKSPKLASLDHNKTQEQPNPNNSELPSPTNCSSEPKEEGHDGVPEDNDECEPENGSDEEEDDDDDEDSEGEAVVDRKGKGILRDDKGKGILIEEDEEDDDSDSDSDDDDDSDGYISGSDSDFSDDPLAEVDLNNILPSRTRRQTGNSGVRIAGDVGKAGNDDDDGDS